MSYQLVNNVKCIAYSGSTPEDGVYEILEESAPLLWTPLKVLKEHGLVKYNSEWFHRPQFKKHWFVKLQHPKMDAPRFYY